jgi:hypothetical protein
MTAARELHKRGGPSEEAIRDEIALRVWAEAEQLVMTLANPDTPQGDHDRPHRLRSLAQTILQMNEGR